MMHDCLSIHMVIIVITALFFTFLVRYLPILLPSPTCRVLVYWSLNMR